MADEKARLSRLEHERAEAEAQDAKSPTSPRSNQASIDDAPPPAYSPSASPSSSRAPGVGTGANLAPTVSEPLNFPSDAPLPEYKPRPNSSISATYPIAIPQQLLDPTSPFIAAYPPTLLNYGITAEAWRSFVEAMSAFLTATVSDRALKHTVDVARHISEHPKRYGMGLYKHTKRVGTDIAQNAKRGNVLGVAGGLISGLISIPMHAAFGALGTGMALPATTIGAMSKKPQTPFQRAAAYALVANEKWLCPRGLQVGLMDTQALAALRNMEPKVFLDPAHQTADLTPGERLRALEGSIAPLEVSDVGKMELGKLTTWLVVLPFPLEGDEQSE